MNLIVGFFFGMVLIGIFSGAPRRSTWKRKEWERISRKIAARDAARRDYEAARRTRSCITTLDRPLS